MNFLKKLVLSISVLAVVNVASAGYDPVTGRWHQRDPVGTGPRIIHTSNGPKWVGLNGPVVPSPQTQSPPHIPNVNRVHSVSNPSQQTVNPMNAVEVSQYADGMNLYEYVSSNPVNRVDPFGLWGSDMHYGETHRLAKEIGFKESCAAKIAGADQGVDDLTPATNDAYQKYHFNGKTGILGDFIPYNPGRDAIAAQRWADAVNLLNKKGCDVYSALHLTGQALHGFQDARSHTVSHHADTAWKHVTGPNLFNPHRPDDRNLWPGDWNATSQSTRSTLQAIWADPKVQCICKKK